MSTLKGKFIVIEGGDGAGKSTQRKKIEEWLNENVIFTREPGGTPYAEEIRGLALDHDLAKDADGITQFMLMWASRAEHMNHLIIPSLSEGKTVITDRFDSSSFAYNICAQDRRELEDYFWQTREAVLGLHVPDLYIYLDVTPEVGKTRMSGRDEEKNHFDNRPQEFHQKVREGFFEFFDSEKIPSVIIDASRTPEEIFEDIKKIISELR